MGLLDLFRRRPAPPQSFRAPGAIGGWLGPVPQRRGWLAAQSSNLTADLPGGAAAAPNRDIRWQLSVLRARSRWLAQNDGHTVGYLKSLRRNVVGPDGFGLQMRVRADRDPTQQDQNANDRIEAAWRDWGRVGQCDVTRRLSWKDLCRSVIAGVARDGEVLLHRVRAPRGNRFGFMLQLLDPSMLDEGVNGRPPGTADGNTVRAGVELDRWERPVAYHLRQTVPNDDPAATRGIAYRIVRVPADDLLHLFVTEWPGQVRGVPWMSPGLRALAMLDGYQEAELVAARVSAGKMGFYKQAGGEDVDAELKQDGTLVQEATAGKFELLPEGVEFEAFDPQHPTQAFGDFVKAILRPAASAAGVSYASFANDAAGMSYSALRSTELEDRDEFATLQDWMIGAMCEPIFTDWLGQALLMDALGGLPASKFFKFNAPEFHGRGWQWVDPQNEVAAGKEAIALGISSRTIQAKAQGLDIQKIAEDLRRERDLFGDLVAPVAAPPAAPPPRPDTSNGA
jgi:lambda family phage portal protein